MKIIDWSHFPRFFRPILGLLPSWKFEGHYLPRTSLFVSACSCFAAVNGIRTYFISVTKEESSLDEVSMNSPEGGSTMREIPPGRHHGGSCSRAIRLKYLVIGFHVFVIISSTRRERNARGEELVRARGKGAGKSCTFLWKMKRQVDKASASTLKAELFQRSAPRGF